MIDQTRQYEIAHTLGQRARRRAEERVRAVNQQLDAERTEHHRQIDAELAVELNKLRQRCTAGTLTEADLKP